MMNTTRNSAALTPASIGQWFIDKYRARASDSGVFTVAKQLRKQGVPIEVALRILL